MPLFKWICMDGELLLWKLTLIPLKSINHFILSIIFPNLVGDFFEIWLITDSIWRFVHVGYLFTSEMPH